MNPTERNMETILNYYVFVNLSRVNFSQLAAFLAFVFDTSKLASG